MTTPDLKAYLTSRAGPCCPRCGRGPVKIYKAADYARRKNSLLKDAPCAYFACGRGLTTSQGCGHIFVHSWGSDILRDMTPAEKAWLNETPERVALAKAAQAKVLERLVG